MSHEVIIQLIANTTTKTGLRIYAELDQGRYPTGIKVSEAAIAVPEPKARRLSWRLELHPIANPKEKLKKVQPILTRLLTQ